MMRGVQDSTNSSIANDKALLDQLTQANRSAGPPHTHNIDPAIAGVLTAPGGHHPMQRHPALSPDGGDGDDKKGAKRELSTSKRAAQNRAAQRAFRQRKETHIKKLEEQVREYSVVLPYVGRMQAENAAMRSYIQALQSRLVEAQAEFPPPPAGVDLHAAREDGLPSEIITALQNSATIGDDGGMEGVEGHDGSADVGAPAPVPAPAPTAPMHASQLQASAAQAVAKGVRARGRAAQAALQAAQAHGLQGSIEDRTDPALK